MAMTSSELINKYLLRELHYGLAVYSRLETQTRRSMIEHTLNYSYLAVTERRDTRIPRKTRWHHYLDFFLNVEANLPYIRWPSRQLAKSNAFDPGRQYFIVRYF
jgi:hypothetical protein